MIFKSSKNFYTVSFLWIFMVFLAGLFFVPKSTFKGGNDGPLYFIVLPILILFLWILLETKYEISENNLAYKCGPFKGKIAVASIRKLEYDDKFVKTSFLKLGLGRKGFIVHYNAFDDIFISPKERELFVSELLKINPDIIIKKESQ